MKIGLLSDTHGYLDDQIFGYFADCDEIWHAGDIGNLVVSEQLTAFKPFQAVYGNIDGADLRLRYPEDVWLEREGLVVWMTHIGGYPPRYNPRTRTILAERQPDVMICGQFSYSESDQRPQTQSDALPQPRSCRSARFSSGANTTALHHKAGESKRIGSDRIGSVNRLWSFELITYPGSVPHRPPEACLRRPRETQALGAFIFLGPLTARLRRIPCPADSSATHRQK